jgi:hypothetical protein
MTYKQEVCVRAIDEEEAEEIARNANFDTAMCDIEAEAEDMYNEAGDKRLVEEFKAEGKYAESEEKDE